MNLAAQDKILSALTETNAAFADYRKKILEDNERFVDLYNLIFDFFLQPSVHTENDYFNAYFSL